VAGARKQYEIVDEQQRYELLDPEPFDRIAFAMRALSILRPRDMTVVVYPRGRGMRIERTLDPSRGPAGRFALVGIPEHASRELIAFELAALAGAADRTWVVPALLAAGEGSS
jgi:hypothetical protein